MNEQRRFNKAKALGLIALIWAGIYLPALGVREFHGEEATRALPGIAMLEGASWLVPTMGGENYYRKPPVINWLVAGSMYLTGQRTELAARLPSAVAVLAFAITLVLVRSAWMDLRARTLSAIVFMTIGLIIEKGRLIEIDATYACFTGIGIWWYLAQWSFGKRGWSLWAVPSIFITVAMLEKGPLHLLPFYAAVIAVAAASGELRKLISLPAFAGACLICGVFGSWAILARGEATDQMSKTISSQFWIRFDPRLIEWEPWLTHIAKMLTVVFLPWLVCIPMWFSKQVHANLGPQSSRVFRSCRLATIVSFLLLMIMPAFRTRYALPVFPLVAILIGWAASNYVNSPRLDKLWRGALGLGFVAATATALVGLIWFSSGAGGYVAAGVTVIALGAVASSRRRYQGTFRLGVMTAALTVVVVFQYAAFAAVPMKRFERLRPVGQQVAEFVPPGQTLYVLRPRRHSFVFYLPRPSHFILPGDEIGDGVEYLILRQADLQSLRQGDNPRIRAGEILFELPDTIKDRFVLVRLAGG